MTSLSPNPVRSGAASRGLRCAVLMLLVAWPALGEAQARLPLTLEWRAPAECPDGDAARRELEGVARVRPGYRLEPLVARVAIERTGARYVARLHTERAGQAGERGLDAPDCPTLVRSLTLVLALAFGDGVELTTSAARPDAARSGGGRSPPRRAAIAQPEGRREAAPGEELPGAPPDAPPEVPSVSEAAAQSAPGGLEAADSAPSRPLQLRALLAGGVQLSPLPSLNSYVALGVELQRPGAPYALQLRAGALPAVSDAVPGGGRARFDGLFVGAAACLPLPLAGLQLSPCARARLSALRGRSQGLDRNEASIAPWSVLSGLVALTWPASGPVRASLEAALGVSLDRPRFVVEGLGEVHRVPLVTSELGLALSLTP